MNLIDRVAELQKLEAKATSGDWYSHDEYITTKDEIDIDGEGDRRIDVPYDSYDADFISEMRNSAPELLDILGEIRPGDADALEEIADILEEAGFVAKAAYVRRYQAMAAKMETENK